MNFEIQSWISLNKRTLRDIPVRKYGCHCGTSLVSAKWNKQLTLFTVPRFVYSATYFLLSYVNRWLLENQRKFNYDVTIKNITDDIACLGVAGPHSRDVLSKLTSSDMGDEKFPYLSFTNIEIAGLPVQASRFSFTGKRYYVHWIIWLTGVLAQMWG